MTGFIDRSCSVSHLAACRRAGGTLVYAFLFRPRLQSGWLYSIQIILVARNRFKLNKYQLFLNSSRALFKTGLVICLKVP
uniref:Uncharacterized protein n=1 Tax=Pararge aegeria TaxID=116150 RepID=S4NQP5_9NEOP